MKIICFSMMMLFSPLIVQATTITAYSHLEEHIQVLHKTSYSQSSSGQLESYVSSDALPEHYLQGYAKAQANINGYLSVSAVGLSDLYDGVETYLTSTASWSRDYTNTDDGRNFLFDFQISDINIEADYRGSSSNRTGYEVEVFINDELLYSQSFLYDTSSLFEEYIDAMDNGDDNPPAGESYFTLQGTEQQLDLGYFDNGEMFNVKYQVSVFAQPIDMSSCYIDMGVSGRLATAITPVPEPAGFLLLGIGLVPTFGLMVRKKFIQDV